MTPCIILEPKHVVVAPSGMVSSGSWIKIALSSTLKFYAESLSYEATLINDLSVL